MRILFFAILFFLTANGAIAQADTIAKPVRVVMTIEDSIVDFTVDNLDNLYVINTNYTLKKISSDGDSVGVYNDIRRYGRLSFLDVNNPLKLLLFHKDFATVIEVDRMLKVLNTIDLRKSNILQPLAIAQSFDNGIWVYDETDIKLKRINDDGDQLVQFNDFRMLFNEVPSPQVMIDQDRLLYVYDPAIGVYIFDYFGTLKSKVALLGWDDFQVINKTLYGRKGTTLYKYHPGTMTLEDQPFVTMLEGVEKVRLTQKYIYCLRGGKVYIYDMQPAN